MRSCIVTFRSITYAQRAQEVLLSAGVSANLGRTPRNLEQKGCGYSLRISREQSRFALETLSQNLIPYGKLYCRNENGVMEVHL